MRIGRIWTWWNATRDRKSNLPAPEAKALGDAEAQIVAAVDASTRRREERYHRSAESKLRVLSDARRQLETIDLPHFRTLVERTGRTHEELVLSSGWHGFLLAVLTLGELAFNMIVFLVFGESTLLTWAMAAAIGLGLPATAAFFGADLRQARWTAPRIAGWTAMLAVVGATLAGVNYVRTSYLSAAGQGEFVAGHQGLTLAYFSINIFVFLAATLVSYYGNDPERGFVEAKRRVERGRRTLADTKAALNRMGRELRAGVAQEQANALGLIRRYRAINRRGRSAVPTYFVDEAVYPNTPRFHEPDLPEFDDQESDEQVMVPVPGRAAAPSTALLVVALGLGALGSTACATQAEDARMVVMLVDGSCSVSNRAPYSGAWTTVVNNLRPGDRALLGRITADTYSTFAAVADEALPGRSMLDNPLLGERKDKATRAALAARYADLDAQPCASRTPVLDATVMAGKLFSGETRRGVLVVASDMLEDSERYRFDRMRLTPAATDRILRERREDGLLPDLRGVTVYVAGAGGPSTMLARQVENFWQAYFRATGASLSPSHYGPTLMSYERVSPPRSAPEAESPDAAATSRLARYVARVWPR